MIYIIFLTIIASIISILLIRWINKREKNRIEEFAKWADERKTYYINQNFISELYQEFIKTKKKC